MTERSRSLPQSAKFHALCGEVARQAKFSGRALSAQQWKVLLVSAHEIVAGADPELVQGLQGEFVMLRESTARMSSDRMNSLLEFCICWATENGIQLTK